jgi:hypothetical protein
VEKKKSKVYCEECRFFTQRLKMIGREREGCNMDAPFYERYKTVWEETCKSAGNTIEEDTHRRRVRKQLNKPSVANRDNDCKWFEKKEE